MLGNPDIHRCADGSIDFDFYRRRAARYRRLTRRAVARHYLRILGRTGRTVLTALITLISGFVRPSRSALGEAGDVTNYLPRRPPALGH
jgi:hypothetical protein